METCTTADLAKRLGVTRGTIIHHIRVGHLRATRHGRMYAIPLAEADRVAATYRRKGMWTTVEDPA